MVALVHCQIGGTGESLAAVFTLERFLAAMPPHVDHQVVVPDESLAALRTQELLRMFVVELHVFGQVGLRQETLVAGLALEAFLAHVALDVHVSVFLGREGLQADVALVLFLAQRLKKGSMNRISEFIRTKKSVLVDLSLGSSLHASTYYQRVIIIVSYIVVGYDVIKFATYNT